MGDDTLMHQAINWKVKNLSFEYVGKIDCIYLKLLSQ